MKSLLFFVFLLFTIITTAQKKESHFVLLGEIVGQKEGWINLSYIDSEGTNVKDSTQIKNGKFKISGKIDHPTRVYLNSNLHADNEDNATSFFLEPSTINIKLEANRFKERVVSGSKTEKETGVLSTKIKNITDTGEIRTQRTFQLMQEFISTHKSSYYSIFLLAINKNSWPFKVIQSLYHQLDTVLYDSEHGRFISKVIRDAEENSPGKTAKLFATMDWKDAPLELRSFEGKFVLLDFWASWCVPCRQTAPKLIELFNRFNSKGLEIIGVSVDNNLNAWKEAITKDKTDIWYHLVSNKSSSEKAKIDVIYGIRTYPTKILIDRNGMIIGRFTGTEEDNDLEEMLKKVLGN
ncbi:MAG: thioredoxin-like domain-containing protein [Chitinophagaceae bacterium]